MRRRVRPTAVVLIAEDAQVPRCAEVQRRWKSQCRPKNRCLASAKKLAFQDILRLLGWDNCCNQAMSLTENSRPAGGRQVDLACSARDRWHQQYFIAILKRIR